ncbi:L-xylulose reductase-like [Thalassophryne amazonica]|uniref:L-xylulose reductase-like n=1 Tax=Thalassophryne amazonica TaxID=390379 RepID=UPI00147086B3|nr:L-xylulose reductase-like [Thalassophryne amazonica]
MVLNTLEKLKNMTLTGRNSPVTSEHVMLGPQCPSIIPVCVDLADWEATAEALKDVGPIDLLVNNAACLKVESLLEVQPEDFDRLFHVNVKAVLQVSQVVARGMMARGQGGSIVNVSSIAAHRALPGLGTYCATKAALQMLTKSLAMELGPHQIRVNSVDPTVVKTGMGRQAFASPERVSAMMSRIPLGHFAEVDDVVNSILFLLSDKTNMTNGAALLVDGGLIAC